MINHAFTERLTNRDWEQVGRQLHDSGYALLPQVLDAVECRSLVELYAVGEARIYRKTISMARYRFGSGEYKYYSYPLPALVARLRETLYPRLIPVANQLMAELAVDMRFPATHAEMLRRCRDHQQDHPTPLILKYGAGGFNTLHQDLYGEIYFPIQAMVMLDEPGQDYTGGEFVITEQVPRAQSKASVLVPHRGDMVLFTTQSRPVQGSRGYYRVNMRHGVSTVHSGHRHSLGIIFHDGSS
ncbi:MAG: prolyl 4-hydroxylase subunit alpha [Chitinophagaceae bacterium]|nr:MAG: prolyl 4-hydroxylase subunit alpha [Chitinophagaceae bacterium]